MEEYKTRALSEIRKHARETDKLNGYYAGLYDAYMTAQGIPDMIIEDLEHKPEGGESS